MRQVVTPLGAALRGAVAGMVGSAALEAFFKLTKPLRPRTPKGAFAPVEAEQLVETPTETLARRAVEGLAARDPLAPRAKAVAAEAVHYAFGAGWGALYGLARESVPALDCAPCAVGYGAVVKVASDDLLMPAFKLAGAPHRYPLAVHAYLLAGHVVFGLATWAAYDLLRPSRPFERSRRVGLRTLGLLAPWIPGAPGKVARTALTVARARRLLAV